MPKQLSEFESAFASARKSGAKDFEFKGKKYSTALKGEGKSSTPKNPFGKGGEQYEFKTPVQKGQAKLDARMASTPKPKDLAPGTGVSKSMQQPIPATNMQERDQRRSEAFKDVPSAPVPGYLKPQSPSGTMGYKPGASTTGITGVQKSTMLQKASTEANKKKQPGITQKDPSKQNRPAGKGFKIKSGSSSYKPATQNRAAKKKEEMPEGTLR